MSRPAAEPSIASETVPAAPLSGVPGPIESVVARRLIVAAAIVAVGTSVLGSAISPWLLTHLPVGLLALAPEPRHVVLTSPVLSGSVIVSVTVVRRVLGLIALYWFGRAYGASALEYVERRSGRMGKYLRWIERGLIRFGVPLVAVLPMPSVSVLAGVARTRFVWTALAMTVGQLGWVTLTWLFGETLATWTQPVVDFLGAHVLEATVVMVVVVVVWQVHGHLSARRRRARSD